MLKKASLVFGIVFVLIGILGFVPAATTAAPMEWHRLLLWVFEINTWHNIIHLASWIVALLCCCNVLYAKRYLQIFGIVYWLVAILWMVDMNWPLLWIVAHNMADLWLHIVITVTSLYLWFGYTWMKISSHSKSTM